MKATQDNAEWFSNTYKQGTSEDNWAAVKATVRSPKIPLVVESATTTSATVHAPYVPPGATADYVLYNPTDGHVPYTVSVNNNVASTLSNDNFVVQNNSSQATYLDGVEDAGCGIFTPDGSFAYFKSYTGGFWYKISLSNPFKIADATNTLSSTFLLTTLASEDNNQNMMVSYAAGGNYIYLWGKGKVVARYTLTTPYLMETATDLQTYDLTSFITSALTSSGYLSNSGFVGFKVSADGTKGMAAFKRWNSTDGNERFNYTFQGFELSAPFDLSTLTVTSQGNPFSYDGNGQFINAISFSESGDYVLGFAGPYTSNQYLRSYYLSTPWDVSAASNITSEYINTFWTSSNFYSDQFSFLWNPVDDHLYATSDQGSHYYDMSGSGMPSTGNPYPTATLDYTGAGLTVAPTVIYEDSVTSSDIKVAQITRADADQDGMPLAISSSSTSTSLSVFPPMDYQGSTALNNKKVSVDGLELSLGTPTFSDNQINVVSTETSAQSITNRAAGVHSHATYEQLVNLDDPATRAPGAANSWSQSCGIDFDNTGTRFFYSGYAQSGSVNFGADIGTAVVRPIVEYSLTTPWDLSTATRFRAFDGEDHFKTGAPNANAVSYYANDFKFNADGTKFYTLNLDSSPRVSWMWEYDLSTPFDLTTISFVRETYLNPFISNNDDIYSFAISDDGKFMKLYYSSGSADLTSTTYLQSALLSFGTPYDTSTLSFVRFLGSRQYKKSFTGDSTYGYVSYGVEYPNNSAPRYNVYYVSTISGNGNNTASSSDVLDMSQMEGFNDGMWGNTMIGKTIVVDGGTKMYIHLPELHSVAMFTGPFGNFRDMYTVDSTSLSLSDQPRQVEFTVPASFTSMGSTSLSSNTNLYKEYATPEVSIDAEALKFKIEGDTGATVIRFNADLFT